MTITPPTRPWFIRVFRGVMDRITSKYLFWSMRSDMKLDNVHEAAHSAVALQLGHSPCAHGDACPFEGDVLVFGEPGARRLVRAEGVPAPSPSSVALYPETKTKGSLDRCTVNDVLTVALASIGWIARTETDFEWVNDLTHQVAHAIDHPA